MIHERGYWLSTEETKTYNYDKSLCDAVILMAKNFAKTVVDIGCGNGAYVMNFIQNGFDCVGFDGSPLTLELTNNVCRVKDFSEHADIGKYDLVLCLEVGEHIPRKYEQIFIDNLCRAAKSHVILTWSAKKHRGLGHVNCRDGDYIINEMSKRGFNLDLNATKFLKEKSKFSWLKNSIKVFVKNNEEQREMKHYYQDIHGWSAFLALYAEMVNKFPDGSHFVEIGSWKGRSAVYMGVEIVNSKKKIQFDCVDNWKFDDEIYSTDLSLDKMKHTAFEEFLKNIEPLSSVINYHKMDSFEGSKLYADESLDFVFIDGSHEYENVKNDLIHWFPKVKYGGVIAGHDYCLDGLHGVKLAVDEFFKEKKFEIRFKTTWIHYK